MLENRFGRFYVGSTDDLMRRLAEHNDPSRDKSKYAAKNGPWRLLWSEPHETRSAAMDRERQIKRMKSARWIRERLLASGFAADDAKTNARGLDSPPAPPVSSILRFPAAIPR